MISRRYLKERLTYNRVTGKFVWKNSSRSARWDGRTAGCKDEDGYLYIRLNGVLYAAHRLAWFYETGEWPDVIDHIDMNPSNNAFMNLRSDCKRINQENRKYANKNNVAGLLGVSPNGNRWAASITTRRIKKHLGTYDTPEEAHEVYLREKRKLHEGCTV